VIALIDAWEISSRVQSGRISHLGSIAWGVVSALLMAAIGGLTRYATSWAGTVQASVPKESLDAIDRGLIAYTAIYSCILGFVIAFFVSEVLINLRAPKVRKTRFREGS